MIRALFLDRDGVINIDHGYVGSVKDVTFCDGIFDLVKAAHDNNIKTFIVTNQSGIGRGFYSEKDFLEVMNYILTVFESKGCPIEDYRWCPHSPNDLCSCRKPNPSMVLDLANIYNVDLTKSALIGDKISDSECAARAGIRYNFLLRGVVLDERTGADLTSNERSFSHEYNGIETLITGKIWEDFLFDCILESNY